MKKLLAKIRKILKDRRTRQLLTRIVSITAAVVVFITTYALVLPAITMESEANCGIPAHQHDDSCYEDRLICGQVESPGHQHTDTCYSISKSLICTETEHQHDDSCFDEDGNLTCELAEHTHDDSCYEDVRELVCSIPESEGHEHTDDCYERVLACGMEAHTHSTACYSHGSELTASAPSDFAAVATTELGSNGATVSASTETEANSEETSNTWASDESTAGGLSSTATAAGTASTGFDAATAEDAFVSQLEPIFFEQILTKDTGIYYYHAEEGEEVPENSADIADWKRVNDDTELAPTDLLRVYLRYTIPAGALNSTNDIARYRLPSNLHLTDQQMEAINTTVNGIANQYVNLDTLEITDTERYNTYLGIEATEGTRKPSNNIDEYFANHPDLEGQEYINAVVRAENVFDETTEEYLGQDLVFTFTPYTVQKNQHEYDAEGQPTKAGQKVNGWLCFDLHMDQIDWSEPVISTIEDFTASAQDVPVENTEDIESSDTTEATEKAASDMDEDASLSSSNPEALNTNTLTEKTESSAEIVFATKDNALKIDEISTELHQVELNTIEKENETAQDEPDQSADDSTDNANSGTTDSEADTADDSIPEGEADKSESADDSATDSENQPESAMEINAETYPAVSFEDTITVQAGTLSTDNENAAKETPAETAITVSVIAEEETFPLGTTMQLGTVEDLDTVASAVEGAVEGQTRGFHAVDISFHNADGEEIEPLKPIKVSMTSDAIKQAVEDSSTAPVVVHVENPTDSNQANLSDRDSDRKENSTDNSSSGIAETDESASLDAAVSAPADESTDKNEEPPQADTTIKSPVATLIETTETSSEENTANNKETPDTLSFDAGSFSVYAIVYTVDFHWEVNGKTYDFSIPGGGFVSLYNLVETLGIGETDTTQRGLGTEKEKSEGVNASESNSQSAQEEASRKSVESNNDTLSLNNAEHSEMTKSFVEEVSSVEFSNPELVWVGKVKAETTVRELKESNELEVKYSGNLTVKDIAEINAQTVKAGDWALISVKPFTSEETLTITMKNADVFVIRISGNSYYGSEKIQYSSADGSMIVTAVAPVGVLPTGTKIILREIAPFEEKDKVADEEMHLYANAVNAVANMLTESGHSVSDAKICDISFIDISGKEIEPSSDVDISLRLGANPELKDSERIKLAHISEDGRAESIDVDLDNNEALFSSDSFSVYVVFKDNSTALSEPIYVEQGWIRIGGDYKKPNPNVLPSGLHTDDDHNGQKNYLRINLYTLNTGRSQNSTRAADYSLTKTFEYLYGTGNVVLEDYELNGRINMIEFTPADREMVTSKYTDAGGIKTSYEAEQAFHNWTESSWGVYPNVMNIYVNTTKPATTTGTDYVVRYYHADGSYDEATGTLTYGQTFRVEPNAHMRSNESYSGLTIGTGQSSLTNVSTEAGTATIHYNSGVALTKVNVYYKENIQQKTAGPVTGEPEYDTKIVNGKKIYDTSRDGIHTDKTATVTTNTDLQDGRTFDLTLETWNIGGNFANVGMVLDASGSMVWTSNIPTALKVPAHLIQRYGKNTWLTQAQVNTILNTHYTDNSKLNYNGYKYYILDPAYGVNEYVALGYFDGNLISEWTQWTDGNWYQGMRSDGKYYASNDIQFANSTSHNNTFTAPTAGWYYVNSGKATQYKAYGTAKSYSNYDYERDGADGLASQFWIDNDGILHCDWWRTGKRSKNASNQAQQWSSVVYVAANDDDNKSEVLQNSIGQFAGMLSAVSPGSQISMTRFSRNSSGDDNFSSSQLSLLNWTNSTSEVSAALNQLYGNGTAMDPGTHNGLQVFNYGFTGQTSTKTGITAFMEKLTNNRANQYTPTVTNNGASKYLIIFTDGKDTDIPDNSNTSASKQATKLKQAGYTIFTVLMQSAGMDQTEVDDATDFLKGLAGTKNSTASEKDNYFFTSMYDDPAALVRNFQTIARKISEPLEGYMIRDYIDPRFDIIDSSGKVLTQLNPQGRWSPRSITTSDGKTAILKYDSNKEMFYVEIEQQTIPTIPKNATGDVVAVNSTKLTVRAKQDFLGGEDILTNGNESEQNSVFMPVDGYSTQTDAPTQANSAADKKDFPKTTTNPSTLNITLSNYEDTIFLGETISPGNLYESVQSKRDNVVDYRSIYFNYLLRAGQKFQNDPTYYVNLLKYGTVPTGASNNDPSKDMNGNIITDFVFVKDANGVTKLTLPYYYLENPGDVTSYAGGTLHQDDKVGNVTYSWKALTTGGHSLTDNNALRNYDSTTVDTVRYQMSITYKADPYDLTKIINNSNQIVGDNIANNGSVRTLVLTGQKGSDKLIKDPTGIGSTPVPEQKTDLDEEGFAVIHVVAGKFRVIKRIEISDTKWTNLVEKAGENGLTFSFQLMKDGVVYGTPFSINTNSAAKSVNGNYIELKSEWIDNLPKGNYTVTEIDQPSGFAFKSVSFASITSEDADAMRVGGTPFAAPTTGISTWKIGTEEGGIPSSTTYASTDFSATKVKDDNKEVDPNKAKAYLNAQIGKGVILNDPPKEADITLKKVDRSSGESIGGAKFAIVKESEYMDLQALTISKLISSEDDPVIETITVGANTNIKVVTIPKGGIKIEGLVDGNYILKEMAAPEGYVITNPGVDFIIENGSLKDHTDAETGINFKVENEIGAELPSTGGPGTQLFYLIGFLLTALAGASLVFQKHWRNAA